MKRNIKILTLAAALMAVGNMESMMAHAQTQSGPAQSQPQAREPLTSTLPNGATSLNETYQDWVVLCSSGETGRTCVLAQQQRKSDTNQLVLALELTSISDDEARGALVLPFGLRLAEGVTLQVDDGPVSKPLAIATCLPAGCIVPVHFDAAMLKSIRAGTTLRLVAKAHDSGQNVGLVVSLKGFASAHDRVTALSRS